MGTSFLLENTYTSLVKLIQNNTRDLTSENIDDVISLFLRLFVQSSLSI